MCPTLCLLAFPSLRIIERRPMPSLVVWDCSTTVWPFSCVHSPRSSYCFLDDADFLVRQAVELADQLGDLSVGRADLALRPIYDYSTIGSLLSRLRPNSSWTAPPSASSRTALLRRKNTKNEDVTPIIHVQLGVGCGCP
jgi:hypothetical protein